MASVCDEFYRSVRDRYNRVGLQLPSIEVQFHHLEVDANVYVGNRALPTLFNYTINTLEDFLGLIGISQTKKQQLNILKAVSGIIRPCRLTLLLGPPSSGKSTLLKALGGRLPDELTVSGKLTYNGQDFCDFQPSLTSVYVGQTDLHMGEMTVRETIDFAARCLGVGDRAETLSKIQELEKELRVIPDPSIDSFMKDALEPKKITDSIIKALGLEICADTLVGDQMRRGISGGQKKRLTIAEMLVGPAPLLLMDEISTGLDSSTTYQIVNYLKQRAHFMNSTVVTSLLQPAPEVYHLFDDIILLSEGYIVYQGPCNLVLQFFESLGFHCPQRKNVADFLQEVTSKKDQAHYWEDKSGHGQYTFVTAREFSEAFKSFPVGQQLCEELGAFFDVAKTYPGACLRPKSPRMISEWTLLSTCFARELIIIRRNAFTYFFKTAQFVFLGAVLVSLFFHTRHDVSVDDGTFFMAALFYTVMITMYNAVAEIPMTNYRLPVFFKQRNLFYPAWVFALPIWVMQMQFSVIAVTLWTVMTYWSMGYVREVQRFFKQYLLLLLLHNMSMAYFRFCSSLCRNLKLASCCASIGLLFFVASGGFIIAKDQIQSWCSWGYWLSPLSYSLNAIAVNEFISSKWNVVKQASKDSIGNFVLKSQSIPTSSSSYWIGIVVLLGYTGIFNLLFTLCLTYLGPPARASSQLNDHPTDVTRKGHVNPKGMVLPFQPCSIVFHRLSYSIVKTTEMKRPGDTEDKLLLIQDISGAFRPGVLTALAGVSGAGKTTLMDVLAGRKTGGNIEGSVFINGYPKQQDTFARISGYCEQNDIHSPYVTVYESLLYSAWLRLPKSVDKVTRMMFVQEVMDLVELTNLREALVGLPGVSGLSVEQRKRLTIAVELVANPSIIFMDEPTSGLDARAAAIVMRTVRNTVNTGRTVVCTIHQPSIDMFESFDELLLLKLGGRTIYAGPLGKNCQDLISYFQSIDGILPIPDDQNPATWMLEITTKELEAKLNIDFSDIYNQSTLSKQNETLVSGLSRPLSNSKELWFDTKHSRSFATQFRACLWKQHWSYWRNPQYNVMRLLFDTVCAIILGAIFWKIGAHIRTLQDLSNVMGSMAACLLFMGYDNIRSSMPLVSLERTVFYRELAGGMYSVLPYALAQLVIEIPYVLVQTFVYQLIVYSMLGYEWTAPKFLYSILFAYLSFLACTYFGMMMMVLSPDLHVATIATSPIFNLWNLLSGFFIAPPRVPGLWRWFHWANPIAWNINGLITSQLGDRHTLIGQEAIKEMIQVHYGYDSRLLGVVVAMHLVFVAAFASLFVLGLKFFSFQRR